MPPPTYRRRSGPGFLVIGIAVLLLAGGAYGSLIAVGVVPSPFREKAKPVVNHDGQVPVPTAAKFIPAYTRITRDEIVDVKEMSIHYTWLPREAVRPEMILDFGKILGRVLKADKREGIAFTENDFLPEGTRPGIAGAVPPGKRSFVLDPEKVLGVAELRPGDHFDIIASQVIDERGKPVSATAPESAADSTDRPARRATSHMVVEDAVLLTRVTTRDVTVSAPTAAGGKPKTKPVAEVTIALDPAEAILLTEALAVDCRLSAAARSGQPKAAGELSRGEMVAVPTLTRPLTLYAAVTRDHLLDEKTHRFARVFFRPDEAPKDAILDPADVIGRVAKTVKRPGEYLSETDFYPKGTPPGLAAGIPEGKRAFGLHAGKVNGLAGLKAGDHFDILTTIKIDPKATPDPKLLGPGLIPLQTKTARVRVVVADGVVVLPAGSHPANPTEAKAAEAVIAVAPKEVPELSEALTLEAELFCAARSSQGGSTADAGIPSKEPTPVPRVRVVEVIVDGKRTTRTFLENGQPVELPPPAPAETPAPPKKKDN